MESEITINNIKYYSEEKYRNDLEDITQKLKSLKEELLKGEFEKEIKKEPCKRFDTSREYKLSKLFSSIFTESTDNSINEEYAIKNGVSIIDPPNVLLCVALSEEAKRFLSKYKSFDSEDKPDPLLDYNTEGLFGQSRSKFSIEYLRRILLILNLHSDSLTMFMRRDYPITIQNEHFKFVLAPRVDPEDG